MTLPQELIDAIDERGEDRVAFITRAVKELLGKHAGAHDRARRSEDEDDISTNS